MAASTIAIDDQFRRAIAAQVKQGRSVHKLAMAAGLPQSTFARLVKGEGFPRIDTAQRMAVALGLRLKLVAIPADEPAEDSPPLATLASA